MSVGALPDLRLAGEGEFASRFRDLGVGDYRAAARYVRDLPYGRNKDRSNYRLVLEEGRGTCSTKHALLAALAREHGLRVGLRIGIYLMDRRNTPGVAAVLRRHNLASVPEAHCYLAFGDARVDVTGVEGGEVGTFLFEETIDPAQIGSYKVERHKAFVRSWAAERGLDPAYAWRVRERCIEALSDAGD